MDDNHIQHKRDMMMIVDDDFINREVLKNMFTDMFRFEEAENGQEGLRKIEQHEHELGAILLDVDMPVMGGIELLTRLSEKDIPSRIPVFLITSNDELGVARAAYDMGVMGVINKPVIPFITVRRVQLVTELFQARDRLNIRVQDQKKQLKENEETIDTIHRNAIVALASAIEFRDVESGEHTNRIYDITKRLLRDTEMGEGLSASDIENMAIGSIMHDVGKIAISDIILNKPGKLTREEFETMKAHTVKGAALMDQLINMQSHDSYRYARDIALHHHERWDGRGYPEGLKGDEITVWSQVVSIADVYDALVSPRVYKKAFTPDRALEMIVGGECGVFNPKLLQCFLQVEPEIRKLYIQQDESIAEPIEHPVRSIYTGEKKERESHATELIDVLLLTAAVQSAYDLIISVNLTQNSYYMMDYDRFKTHCVGYDGVFDDLIAGGAASIPESHRQQFIDTFSRESLLKAYAEGKKAVNLDHPQYSDTGEVLQVSTSVLFMEDPRNGDIREITLARYNWGGNWGIEG